VPEVRPSVYAVTFWVAKSVIKKSKSRALSNDVACDLVSLLEPWTLNFSKVDKITSNSSTNTARASSHSTHLVRLRGKILDLRVLLQLDSILTSKAICLAGE